MSDKHSPFRNPLSSLFRVQDNGKHELPLKPASSSPPDASTRQLSSEMEYDFDPNQEAKPQEASVIEILREIRNAIRDMRPNPPADNFRPMLITIPSTGAGEQQIDVIGGYEYIYVPPVPRSVTIFWRSRSWPLGLLQVGQAANIHIPYRLDEFSLSWGAGAANDVIYLLFTTDPISIDILAY